MDSTTADVEAEYQDPIDSYDPFRISSIFDERPSPATFQDDPLSEVNRLAADMDENELGALVAVARSLSRPVAVRYLVETDIMPPAAVEALAVQAKLHHASSSRALAKDACEEAILSAVLGSGLDARLARKNNPGHDMVIAGQLVSVKTQGDQTISDNLVKIHKRMEAGRGDWPTTVEGFEELKLQVADHLSRYDRIIMVRRLKRPRGHRYEVLEVPIPLLLEAVTSPVVISRSTKGNTPYAREPSASVFSTSATGRKRFKMQFDGGGERKIAASVDKRLCTVIATFVIDP